MTAPAGSIDPAEVGDGLIHEQVGVHDLAGGIRAADPGEREQVVDQHLHALGPVHGEVDVLVGALVELAAVALLEQLAERRHLAERLLQVVRGHVGELLQLGVRAGQLARLAFEGVAWPPRPGPGPPPPGGAWRRRPPRARAARPAPGARPGGRKEPAVTARASSSSQNEGLFDVAADQHVEPADDEQHDRRREDQHRDQPGRGLPQGGTGVVALEGQFGPHDVRPPPGRRRTALERRPGPPRTPASRSASPRWPRRRRSGRRRRRATRSAARSTSSSAAATPPIPPTSRCNSADCSTCSARPVV